MNLKKLLPLLITTAFLSLTTASYAQAPTMGTAADFILFSTNGAVSNTGISQLTGNVGTNNGSSTSFGNVNGVMHDQDTASAQCAKDLLVAYKQLNAAIPKFFPHNTFGSGDTFIAGVYAIASASTLNGTLYLNAKGNANAVFIIQIKGAFSTNAGSKVKLINGAKACNVYWKVEGMVNMATGTTMRGTVIANNAAIKIKTGDTLEGRALSTTGAVTVGGLLAYTPIGCGSPLLKGPKAPNLGTAACYALFSGNGAVSNTGITYAKGDIGTNVGLTTGFDSTRVNGIIHAKPDASTKKCLADLDIAYTYLDTIPYDIELLYPAKFGSNLVLTPHTYLLNAATVLTDTVFLNAQGDTDAVFVFQINGALSTSTYAQVVLTNGAQAKNIYWKIDGAVGLNNYSVFKGTIVCHNGALGALNTGVTIDGRALTTSGAITTTAVTAKITSSRCYASTSISSLPSNNTKTDFAIYPNPFNTSLKIVLSDAQNMDHYQLRVYDVLGTEVMFKTLATTTNIIETSGFPSGIYFYQIISNNKILHSGKLICQHN